MSKMCDYIYSKGNDVICYYRNEILGDIMGYDGKKCKRCKYRKKINKLNRKDTNTGIK